MAGLNCAQHWPRLETHTARDRGSSEPDAFPEIDGGSPEIDTLKQHMRRVAEDAYVTVLILGESGTGKERVARAIHGCSPRRNAPFVVVNCAGLSPALVEDELFGHKRGAFTGAIGDHPGPFERANGGTVFLDEVGELTPDLQVKLLRALQQRTVQRLGGRHETPFDVRVIAATNTDLTRAASGGRFREDLYYRLKVYELRVPPLRRRGSEHLKRLTATILKRLGERRGRPAAALDARVWDLFGRHDWPGNVRELENTLERAVVAAGECRWLTPEHLPDDFGTRGPRGAASQASQAANGGALPSPASIAAALERHGSRRGLAASDLGISRHQLYRLLKRHQVQQRQSVPHTDI